MLFSLTQSSLVVSSLFFSLISASTVPAPSAPVTVNIDGSSYVWKGTVAYGTLDGNLVDEFGDSLGGIGSAIGVKRFKLNADGTYSGLIQAQPDRGHNTVELENFAGRSQFISFTLSPCETSICNSAGNPSLTLTYEGGMRYTDTSSFNDNSGFTSGLDPTVSRPASGLFPILPQVPSNGALALDAEGIAFMADGTFWVADEYGPLIYHLAVDGTIMSAISPPDAILPHNANGTLSFTTTGTAPSYGRTPNQGFEGLTISPDNTRLYALVQSALVQDQDPVLTNRQNARMVVYDITVPSSPVLIEQYVVQLPSSDVSTVFAQSEIYYVSDGVLMVLARDGKGNGNGNSPSSTATKKQLTAAYKNIGLITLTGATNINGIYDEYDSSVAPGGVLDPSINPALFNEFINIIDPAQLAKFGLQNGPTPLATDIVGKFESIAIQPVLDPAFPNDYFVFTMADNDFINTNEYFGGVYGGADPYGTVVPTQVFVFRVTLPNADIPSYLLDQSLNPSGLTRSRARRSACPSEMDSCAIGKFGAFECVDILSDLEQCGACASLGGVDCSSLPNVAAVECVQGTCVASSCASGEVANDGVCA